MREYRIRRRADEIRVMDRVWWPNRWQFVADVRIDGREAVLVFLDGMERRFPRYAEIVSERGAARCASVSVPVR